MEKLLMSAGIVVALVLCLVEIFKLPFGKLKEEHPKTYKAIFTLLSFGFAIGLSILDAMYVLEMAILSFDFILLLLAVLAGVFGGYCGIYEGLGLKALIKVIGEKVQEAKSLANDKKVISYLDKIGVEYIDKAIVYLEEKKQNNTNENSEV